MLRLIGLILMAAAACLPAEAQDTRERIVIKQTFKGKAITITGELYLPPGGAKVPAMIVHHGSGGITDARERRYARELVKMGVAALVLDSFTGRGVTSTVRDQSAVSTNDMLGDAFAALKILAGHARIDGAAASAHHQPVQRGKTHGCRNAAAVAQRAEAGAVSEMRHDRAAVRRA